MAFWKRRTPTPSLGAPADVREARALAEELVVPGFLTLAEAREAALEVLAGDTSLSSKAVAEIVTQVWEERKTQQDTWSAEGDYARLRRAYDDLTAQHLVARMNVTCCQQCGTTEIDDERTGGEIGYVFFHAQDTARLGGAEATLYLAFGAFPTHHPRVDQELLRVASGGDEQARSVAAAQIAAADTQVGALIVEALRKSGLAVEWSGSSEQRPAITVSAWQKPLPA